VGFLVVGGVKNLIIIADTFAPGCLRYGQRTLICFEYPLTASKERAFHLSPAGIETIVVMGRMGGLAGPGPQGKRQLESRPLRFNSSRLLSAVSDLDEDHCRRTGRRYGETDETRETG
jgi:hypothetical protein